MTKRFIKLFLTILLLGASWNSFCAEEDDEFKEFEIRVIRPRYFDKRYRLEIGLGPAVITNQSFIYTYMMSGVLAFHFSDSWAIEGDYSYGLSIDKIEKKHLDGDFNIKTEVTRTRSLAEVGLLWTPIYGKFQAESGYLFYSDTYFSVGGGKTELLYKYDHCEATANSSPTARSPDTPAMYSYPSVYLGAGQRFFVSKNSSLKWDLRVNNIIRNASDGSCSTDAAPSTENVTNVVVKMGYSYFL